MIRKKICMIGTFAVGKTSLVRRFVTAKFSDRYETTVGVRILKKAVAVDSTEVNLQIWDLHGDDEFQKLRDSYLRGAFGYLLVVDGTRAGTRDHALELQERAARITENAPFLLLYNKIDLAQDWAIDDALMGRHDAEGWDVRRTSAKTGAGVEEAFHDLAAKMLEADREGAS